MRKCGEKQRDSEPPPILTHPPGLRLCGLSSFGVMGRPHLYTQNAPRGTQTHTDIPLTNAHSVPRGTQTHTQHTHSRYSFTWMHTDTHSHRSFCLEFHWIPIFNQTWGWAVLRGISPLNSPPLGTHPERGPPRRSPASSSHCHRGGPPLQPLVIKAPSPLAASAPG